MMCFAYFFDKLSMDVCTTMHLQTSGQRVQELNVSTLYGIILTHSCLENFLTSVVWTHNNLVNNFRIQHKLEKHFKEICQLVPDQ